MALAWWIYQLRYDHRIQGLGIGRSTRFIVCTSHKFQPKKVKMQSEFLASFALAEIESGALEEPSVHM